MKNFSKKIMVSLIFSVAFMSYVLASVSLVFQSGDLKVIFYDDQLMLVKDGKEFLITKPYQIEGSPQFGFSPNNKYFAYGKGLFSVYFYDTVNKEEKLIAQSDGTAHGAEFYEDIKWVPGSDTDFILFITNDSIGNIELCYYQALKRQHCIKKIEGVSDIYRGDELFYVMPDDFEELEITDDGNLVFKKVFDEDSYELWKTDLKGEKSIKIAEYINGVESKSYFTDVSKGDPFYSLLERAKAQGWINGYPDGTVRLKDSVNRAEFAKMLSIAFEKGEGDGKNLKKFPDVYFDQWYIPFLSKAVELGSMQGYPDGTIKPGDSINKAEALKMAMELLNYDYGETTEGQQWYEKYRQLATDYYNLEFLSIDQMSKDMTRLECIQLIFEVLDNQVRVEEAG